MAARRYWLFKSEPQTYSFEKLMNEPTGRTQWEGVRNYQARNFIRDQMSIGDGVLFYHSSCDVPGIVGIAEVASEASPDPTQFDRKSNFYDRKSPKADPRWWLVEIKPIKALPRIISLAELRQTPGLQNMVVLRRGNRLSITPVTKKEWEIILHIASA